MTTKVFASGTGAQFLIVKGKSPKVMERLTFDDVARVKVTSPRLRIGQTARHAVSRPIGSYLVWAADARRAFIRATLRLPRRPVFWAVPASPPVWQHLVYRLDRTHPQCAASGSPPDLMPRIFLMGPSSGDPPVFGDACAKQIGASAYGPLARGNTGPASY